MEKIGVVIVTYNRLEKLKTALNSYDQQSFLPEYILVINNHSDDGTFEFLKEWEKTYTEQKPGRIAVTLPENIGGSGGFYEALKRAEDMEADWIWVADDDAYPKSDCFRKLRDFYNYYVNKYPDHNLSALCSAVETDGRIDTWHRRRLVNKFGIICEERIPVNKYKQPFHVDFYSFVGTLMKKEALILAGLPEKDFFISYDDSEHSLRMRKTGNIICVPQAQVNHDSPDTFSQDINWKKYYSIRNKIYSYKKNFGLIEAYILAIYYLIKFSKDKGIRKMVSQAIQDAFRGKLGKTRTAS